MESLPAARLRLVRKPALLLALGLVAGIAASCGGSSHSHPGQGFRGPGVSGVVFDYADAPAAGAPIVLDPPNGMTSAVGADGRFFVPAQAGSHILAIGDSVTWAKVFVSVDVTSNGIFLTRPVFLPLLESGVSLFVPPTAGIASLISGSELDGVSLALNSGVVTYPAGTATTNETITLVGVSPTRLPTALPPSTTTRSAYAVEPAGVTFSPAVQLTIPRLEDVSDGPFDLWKLDSSARWSLVAPLAAVSSTGLVATITEGAIYAAVPRVFSPTETVTGRVVSNGRPIPNYRAECWNAVSNPTGPDGRFTIPGVPSSYPALPVRVSPATPGVDFAPEVVAVVQPATMNDVGDVPVTAPPALTVAPTVISTQPADGATGVALQQQVTIQFSEAINPATLAFTVRGTNGPAAGQIFLVNAFTAAFVSTTNLDPSDDYFITLDQSIADLAGNTIDTSKLAFHFTTVAGTPPPPPTDQKIFGLSPLQATSETSVTLSGRNFPGGSAVTVGASSALVQRETATTITFLPPVTEPAQIDTVAVVNSAQTTVTSLGPLTLDLRAAISSISSPTVVREAPPSDLFVAGSNVVSGTLFLDGVAVAAVDSQGLVGTQTLVVSKDLTLIPPVLSTLLTGPASVRGPSGRPGGGYRFLQVRDGTP
jgi:hypothetical protein